MASQPLRVERIVIGLSLMAVGVAWVVANLGQLDLLHALRTWWPTSLIVWGVLELYNTLVMGRNRQ
jgi:hypothetical protein